MIGVFSTILKYIGGSRKCKELMSSRLTFYYEGKHTDGIATEEENENK